MSLPIRGEIPQSFLLISVGCVVSRFFEVSQDGSFFKINSFWQLPTPDNQEDLVDFINTQAGKKFHFISVSPEIPWQIESGLKEFDVLIQLLTCWSALGTDLVFFDIGGGKTWVGQSGNKSADLQYFNLGVAKSARNLLLNHTSEAKIARWIPEFISLEEVGDYVGNKFVFPAFVPDQLRFLFMEQALAREILRGVLQKTEVHWEKIQKVVLSGAVLSSVSDWRQSLNIFLEGASPVGVFQVFVDNVNWLPVLGHIVQDFHSLFTNLGTVVSFSHQLELGEVVARVFIDSGFTEPQEVILRSGDLVRVPLNSTDRCDLSLELAPGTDVPGFDPSAEIVGGELGLILDARGRPFPLPDLSSSGQDRVLKWRNALR